MDAAIRRIERLTRAAAICLAVALALVVPPRAWAETGVTNIIAGTSSNVSSGCFVGSNGAFNALILTNGGTLNIVAFAPWSAIGNTSISSNNYVTVTGPGSVWNNGTTYPGSIYLGNTGSFNQLNIANGGKVVNLSAIIGFDTSSSNNAVLVTGAGSVWSNASDLYVGYNGSFNQMTIADNATVRNNRAHIGYGSSTGNSVLVTGTGTVWVSTDNLNVGYAGSGDALTITNGGKVSAVGVYLGNQAGANSNIMTIIGPGSVLSNSTALGVGDNGSFNCLTIADGAAAYNGDITIGVMANAKNNAVIVSGPGSLLSAVYSLDMGYYGSFNLLAITNGATVCDNYSDLGPVQGANSNRVIVTGAGSSWTNSGNLNVGEAGIGNNLIIGSGGVVYDFSSTLGSQSGANSNVVVVTGAGSAWNNKSFLYVGNDASSNNLIITAGGSVFASNTVIGYRASTGNTIVITGGNLYATNAAGTGKLDVRYGALWLNSGTVVVNQLYLTNKTSSVLTFSAGLLQSGGTIVSNGVTFAVGDGVQSATLGLTGGTNSFANGLWVNTNAVLVSTGIASLVTPTVLNAGQFSINGGTLSVASAFTNAPGGTFNLNAGTVLVPLQMNNMGAFVQNGGFFDPAVFTNSGSFVLNSGTNMDGVFLNLASGTVLQTGGEFDVNYATNSGSWTLSGGVDNLTNFVSDNHGSLTVSGGTFNGSLTIGNTGSVNQLTVTNGGMVTGRAGVLGNISTSSNNWALVSGPSSLWSNSGILTVGYGGSFNQLTLANGGMAFNTTGRVGYTSGANSNAVLVTGAGSVWSNGPELTVGYGGSFNQLTITNGGAVFNVTGWIGSQAGATSNAVLVTGLGSVWSDSADLFVGNSGYSNSLTITNSGSVFNANGWVGKQSGANGNAVLLTGAGSVWSNSGSLTVGSAGAGDQLTITNGATAYSSTGTIGEQAGAKSNTVLVTGTGSVWNDSYSLNVGGSGSRNQLTIANSGMVFDSYGALGCNVGAISNAVLVTGAGSVWSNQESLIVGDAGSFNQLTISNGGTVLNSFYGYIGNQTGANSNAVLVTGAGSTWSNSAMLGVGACGSRNQLTIANSGEVFNTYGYIGYWSGANSNTVLVTDAGSVWNNNSYLEIGDMGSGNNLTIANGGSVCSRWSSIGDYYNANYNTLLVTGAGSTLSNDMGLSVGDYGSFNQLTISNGGTVLIQRFSFGSTDCYIGNEAGANSNAVLVTGTGSVLNCGPSYYGIGSTLYVGFDGLGNQLTITNGGTVLDTWGNIGYAGGANSNTVLVTGAGSVWSNGSDLSVGIGGSFNRLTITNGGTVINAGANIGGNNNAVVVTGAGSVWSNSSSLSVGASGTNNQLTVVNGAQVIVGGGISVGNGATTSGLLYASNAFITSVGLGIGGRGSGVTLVSNTVWNLGSGALTWGGAGAFGDTLVIDATSAITNIVGLTLALTNTTFHMTNSSAKLVIEGLTTNQLQFSPAGMGGLTVGTSGSSNTTLLISNYTLNTTATSYIGNGSGRNTIVVTGPGAMWTSTNDLQVGYSGTGNQLTITNGGTVFDANGYIGYGYGVQSNVVMVTGSGSIWSNSGDLAVGYYGGGSQLTITNGGAVFDANGYVGECGFGSGSALVSGSGSIWSNSGVLWVAGTSGSGGDTLTLTDNGTVAATNVFVGYTGGAPLPTGNAITISGGNLYATNTTGTGFVDVRYGGLTLNSGVMVADNLYIRLFCYSQFTMNGGQILVNGMYNGAPSYQNGGVFDAAFFNNTGNWLIAGGTNQDTVFLSAWASRVQQNGGEHDVSVATNFGSWVISGGVANVANFYNDVALTINGGTLNTSQLISTNTLSAVFFASGTLNSGNTLLSNDPSLQVGDGSGLAILNLNGGTHTFDSGLVAATALSQINFNSGTLNSVSTFISNGTPFQVGNGSSLAVLNLYGGTHTFANGLITTTALSQINFTAGLLNSGGSIISNGTPFAVGDGVSTAALNLVSGTNVFADGLTIAANAAATNTSLLVTPSVTINTSGQFAMNGGQTLMTVVTNAGVFSQDGGFFNLAFFDNPGVLQLANGTNAVATLLDTAGGTVLQTGGEHDVDYATNSGTWTISGGVANLTNFNNLNTLILSGGMMNVSALLVTNVGSVLALNGGTLDTAGSTVNNGSIFQVGNGISAAALDLLGGAHSFGNGLFINTNGSLAGTGAITGSITDAGLIAPGNGLGLLTDTGSLTLLDAGGIAMDLAGTNAGLYDQLDVTSALDFGGTLAVSLLNGYKPQQGDSFSLFSFGSSAGAFGQIYLPALDPQLYWNTSLLYSDGQISVGYLVSSLTNVVVINGQATNYTGTWMVGSNSTLNGLIVTNAGGLVSGGGVIGNSAAASANYALVTGAGSLWTNTGDLYVGATSSFNQLITGSGGRVISTNAHVGLAASAYNNVVQVTDPGSVWSNNGNMYLGDAGFGNSLTVAGGGEVDDIIGYIGLNASANSNSASVSGSGSLWVNSDSLFVGYGGAGNSLVLTNGGSVWATNVVVGANASSTGNVVTVSGGFLYATNAAGGGALSVLYGTLNLNSGTVAVDWLLLTNGINSVFNFNGGVLHAGQMLSTQPLTVNGGTLTLADSFVNLPGATLQLNSGSVIVPGSMANQGSFIQNGGLFDPAVFTNSGSFAFNGGTNMDGVFLNLPSDVVQQSGGEHNANVVTNYGSWAISGGIANLTNLVIDGGGVFTNAGGMLVSTNASGTGNVDVRNGTLALISGTVMVNQLFATNFANSVVSFNGGALTSGGTLVNNGAAFTVGDTGTGAVFNLVGGTHGFSNGWMVGNSGVGGSLLLTHGALAMVNGSSTVGNNASSSSNVIVVTGPDSVWSNNGNLFVGNSGFGNGLVVTNGGMVVVTVYGNQLGGGNVIFGNASTASSNSVLVTGNTSMLIVTNGWPLGNASLVVGQNGSLNALTIANGGIVDNSAGLTTLGGSAYSTSNAVVVTDVGSKLYAGSLTVGGSGSSGIIFLGGFLGGNNDTLTIQNGGFVGDSSATIGAGDTWGESGNNNSVLVTGAGSVWSNAGSLVVGNYGSSNNLTVANASTVIATNLVLGAGYSTGGGWPGPGPITGIIFHLEFPLFGSPLGISNSLSVSGGCLYVTNTADSPGTLNLVSGSLAINGGTVVVDRLCAASAVSTIAFNAGLLCSGGGIVSNGTMFVVGDGSSAAALNLVGGTNVFANGLTIAPNASMTSVATLTAPSMTVNASGQFAMNGGLTTVNAATNAGVWTVATGGLLEIRSNLAISSTGSLTNRNGGDLRLVSNATLNLSGSLVITNATLEFAGASTLATPFLPGITFQNASTIKWAGYGGSFGTHAITGNLNIDLPSGPGLIRGIVDNASLTVGGGSLLVGSANSGNSLLLTNGGTVWATNIIVGASASSTGNVVTVSGGRLYSTNSTGGGALNVLYGTLNLNSGTVTVDRLLLTNFANSVFNFNGGVLQAGQVFSAQPMTVNGGTLTLADSFVNSPGGTLQLNSGGMIVPGSMNNQGSFVQNGGLFDPLVFTNSGSFVLNSGTNMDGVFLNLASGTVQQNGGEHDVNVVTNFGSWTIFGGVANLTNVVIDGGGVFTNAGGLLVSTNALGTGGMDVRNGTLALISGTVTVNQLYATNFANSVVSFNGGTLNSGGSTVNNGSIFQVGDGTDAATLDLFGGTHSFANDLFINTNAILTGTGAITGSITDAGLIAPGNGFGVITNTGNLTMLGNGAVTMELGGTNAWLYDQFDLTGALSFGGTLNVALLNGYTPQAGDQFNLFDFGSGSGAFSVTNLPTLSPTLYWNTSALYSTGVIEADQSTGSVRMVLAPQAAIDAGAAWQVDADGNWHTNNETVAGLVVGSHTLSYTNLIGWIAPTNQTIQIAFGTTTTNTGTYQLTPLLLAAVSRKTQGAGTFDLNLNLNGTPSATVEPRVSGPTQLVFTFNKAMAAADGTLDATEFTVTNATFVSASIASSNLTLNLTSVVDQSKVTVVMNGLTDLAGNPLSGTNAVLVRSLYGDVNQSGTVNAVDLQQVKNNLLAALTPANLLCDVNSSGTINAVDLQQIKNNLLHSASLADSGMTQTLSSSDAGNSVTNSALATTTLGEALGATTLTWSTDGDAPWTATLAEDGSSAAMNGSIGDLNVSWVETTVTGPGTLSFDWMVSSELNGDYLTFAIDGVDQPGAISGEVNWQTLTFNIPAGTHRLTWTYSKNGSTATGLDASWLRRVVYR